MARATRRQAKTGMIDRVAGQAEEIYDGLGEVTADAVEILTDRVTERPFASLAIAFGAGLLFDRLIARRHRTE